MHGPTTSADSSSSRYSNGAIAFHWTIAALVLFNILVGLFHEGLPRAWQLMPLHKSVGLTVLVLSIGRVAWRLGHRPPALPATIAPWERAAAHATHWIFYALIIVMPLTGWAMSSVSRSGQPRPLTWFFLFDVPRLPVSPGVAGIAHESHEILGYLMAVLVVIHVAGALRHHLMLRDSTLMRMLPIVGEPGRRRD